MIRMKSTMIILMSLLSFKSVAQIPSIWRGNTPGHETDWNYPSNWSKNDVPDEFTDVIIPLDNNPGHPYPVLTEGKTAEINSLHIWPGAYLTVEIGQLSVHDIERSIYLRSQILGNGKLKYEGESLLANKEKEDNKLSSVNK